MEALIDGDILVYRCGFAAQKTVYQFVYTDGEIEQFFDKTLSEVKKELKNRHLTPDDGQLQKTIIPEPIENACYLVKSQIQRIMAITGAETFRVFLTSEDKSNYRFDLAKTKPYKGNRTQKKPIHYRELREYLEEQYQAEVIKQEEADDAMGIAQYRTVQGASEYAPEGWCDTIICTIDKDLDMIPGHHCNFVEETTYYINDPGYLQLKSNKRKIIGGGLLWFYAQCLLGDNCDNIPGLKGYGPVKVYNLLNSLTTEEGMLDLVLREYEKVLNKEEAVERLLEVADLLWIRRKPNELKSDNLRELLCKIQTTN